MLHPLMGGASKIIIMVISTFQSYYEIRCLIKKYLANALNIYIYTHYMLNYMLILYFDLPYPAHCVHKKHPIK